MPIDRQTFKEVLGSFAAGVTIVTTIGDEGKPYGLTATAFTSVSLDPPLVLVCVDKRSESHAHFHVSQIFAVNFLAHGQEEYSRRFAASGGDKFGGLDVEYGITGAPLLRGSLAHVDCRIVNIIDAGDHTVFIGQVEAGEVRDVHQPLLYYRGRYAKLG